MSLFEKIYNYQMMARLDEAGAIAITAQERAWLAAMLEHPEAESAFEPDSLHKLKAMLADGGAIGQFAPEAIIEKARSKDVHFYHPLLRPLRQAIAERLGLRLTYAVKDGSYRGSQPCFPFKLEYSMVKREWYLLWYQIRNRAVMSTKLRSIADIESMPVSRQTAEAAEKRMAAYFADKLQHAAIEVVSGYNRELSRILYAFSCFDKDVEYDEERDTYRIRLHFLSDESDFVLSRIRFLGKRVIVTEGGYLRKRMYETTQKALARYGITQ